MSPRHPLVSISSALRSQTHTTTLRIYSPQGLKRRPSYVWCKHLPDEAVSLAHPFKFLIKFVLILHIINRYKHTQIIDVACWVLIPENVMYQAKHLPLLRHRLYGENSLCTSVLLACWDVQFAIAIWGCWWAMAHLAPIREQEPTPPHLLSFCFLVSGNHQWSSKRS